MAIIIDGKAHAVKIKQELAKEVEKLKEKNITVGLAVILVGEDEASKVYVANKIKGCKEAGVESSAYYLTQQTTEKELLFLIDTLNADENINGILVQLPLPNHINEDKILKAIDSKKDVDGFSAENVGNLLLGNPTLAACTPSGVIELIKSTGESIEGKHAVVIGRSNIVGKPQALLLLKENATVTICHSRTKNIAEITKQADILVVAIGKPKFVTKDMVKPGAIVIDVGMNRQDGKLCGDVDFDEVSKVAGYITPVPGGVGPMTIAMLLKNTVKAAEMQKKN